MNPEAILRHGGTYQSDQRVDLAASNVVTAGAGRYVVATVEPPRGQAIILKAMVPYAQRRTDVGAADESFTMIQPGEGNGFFVYEPLINSKSAYQVELDYNKPQLSTVTMSNKDRTKAKGLTFISDNPWRDAWQMVGASLFEILIPGGATFQVVFSLTAMDPIVGSYATAGKYQVGTGGNITRRVDFAGVLLLGVQVPEQAVNGRR